MKHEWKKQEKNLYGAKTTPNLVTVPAQKYIMIDGKGNPNDTDFSRRVSVLFSLAYTSIGVQGVQTRLKRNVRFESK